MRRVICEDGKEVFANSLKHEVGQWYQSWRTEKWYIITSVNAGEVIDEYGDIEQTWFHTFREPSPEELDEREKQQAEWESLTSEERTEKRIAALSAMFPSLDW